MDDFRRETRLLRQVLFFGLLATGLFLASPAPASAAPGDLDPTFGNGGRVTTEFNFAHAADVALQADGKIVVAGTDEGHGAQFVVVRYHPDGSLDTSFGNGGTVSTSIRQFNYARGLAIQADGKIVVSGHAQEGSPALRDFAVVRYLSNGSLDTSFGGDGKVIIEMGGDSFANDLAIQPEGRIVIVGGRGSSYASRDAAFTVVRLQADGSLDASFDGDGIVMTSLGSYSDFGAAAVALQVDGKVVAAGQSGGAPSTANFALVRYHADGSLDASFGGGKVLTAKSSGGWGAWDVAVQPDGKIVAVGSGTSVVRYNGDGLLDSSFGASGIVVTDPGGPNVYGSVIVQPNGKIVAGGYLDGRSVTRLNSDGSPDTSFGGDGTVTTDFDNRGIPYAYGSVNSLTLQPDGRIVAAGNWGVDGEFAHFAVTRHIGDPTFRNDINDVEFFVRQHYHDFLNREADATGLQFWTEEIKSCGVDEQCREVKRVNVSAAFFLSIEFQQTGYLAYRARRAAFGNIQGKPVPITREEMLADMQTVGGGVVVGAENWDQRLEQNKQAYFSQLAASERFSALYPESMTPEAYVDALNQTAGGALSQAEREALVAELKGNAKTRAQVLRAVAEDETLTKAEFNKAFVLMQFFGYLRRDPDSAPDTDFSGYNFWLGKLNEFQGNFIKAEMVKAFLDSIEYRQRFGQ